ncbi:MAG TPA: phage holin family protein [bacterium]|jgi:uncharacterized membrane protein YvlD (DUF360 family)|nr:phage holin family protein [bacterium]HQG58641.1 phage holin family protein [bacterium]HQG79034.1 phage holin family protein [bacterium]HQK41549.1 phage holin family protein [bacterium]
MKLIIRTFLYSALALRAAVLVVGSLSYSSVSNAFLLILAISLLYFFLKPIISIVSLPTKGSVFFLISFLSTAIVFYALKSTIPEIDFVPATLRSLNIFGYVLPSKELDAFWSMVFSALVTSTVYLFLESLCCKK